MSTHRLLPALWASFLFLPAQAQLTNGSFEQAGAPSLEGWEWTCEDPGQVNEAPPGAGAWHATKMAGHAKGCFPNYLYQRLTGVQDGDLLTISGWVRCDDDVICMGANFGLGTLNSGYFQLEESVGNNQWPWQYLTLTDTVELAPGDTSILVLNAGFVGGPINPEPGHFDGFGVEHVLSVSELPALELVSHRDGNDLFIAARNGRIVQADVLDLTGRSVNAIAERNASQCRVTLDALRSGVYFVDVRTDRGEQALRFVVD